MLSRVGLNELLGADSFTKCVGASPAYSLLIICECFTNFLGGCLVDLQVRRFVVSFLAKSHIVVVSFEAG